VRLFVPKRSIKRISIATTQASISFAGRTRSIETKPLATDASRQGGAIGCRATGVFEKLGPLLTLTPAVSFGRVQKPRETVKLFDQLPSMLGRPIRGIIQKRCKQGDESKFNAMDVVKKGIHLKNKTNY
jgi:hypothetical protein